MEETISRMAGSENGSFKTIGSLEQIAASAGRPARQRTTLYGRPSAERIQAARRTDGVGHFALGTAGHGGLGLPPRNRSSSPPNAR
jgi:FO synthase